MSNYVFTIVHADGLALLGTRISAGTVMTNKFDDHACIYKQDHYITC